MPLSWFWWRKKHHLTKLTTASQPQLFLVDMLNFNHHQSHVLWKFRPSIESSQSLGPKYFAFARLGKNAALTSCQCRSRCGTCCPWEIVTAKLVVKWQWSTISFECMAMPWHRNRSHDFFDARVQTAHSFREGKKGREKKKDNVSKQNGTKN